jgi:inhibitor of cysteine peptidase
MMVIMEKYLASIDSDEELRISNELENKMGEYVKENARNLEQTGIVKIGIKDFDVAATGSVPGTPLNQFSLDEYQDNLRVATTISGGMWGSGESANDVYVMNKNLDILGNVKDLGLTERIYSARFIEDKGYIVTFRQIDPFYVIDLRDPNNPKMAGELKIPGFSSYLHPINKDKILGVGEENGKVKISLFDVTDPSDPKEISKYALDEYYTEVEDNHHAFLMDDKHKVFFLPGGKGGYIFSYDNDELTLKMAVSDVSAQRAVYIDDYMYIVGADKISVIDENKWEKVKEFDL